MHDILNTILLGIIEGVTEFLPISSTGHLLIAEKLGLGHRSDLFNVVIQAVLFSLSRFIYWKRLVSLVTGFSKKENRDYAFKLLTAFFITGVLGLIATKLGFKLPDAITPVAWALLIGGVWILIAEWLAAKKADTTNVTMVCRRCCRDCADCRRDFFRVHPAPALQSLRACLPVPAIGQPQLNLHSLLVFQRCMQQAENFYGTRTSTEAEERTGGAWHCVCCLDNYGIPCCQMATALHSNASFHAFCYLSYYSWWSHSRIFCVREIVLHLFLKKSPFISSVYLRVDSYLRDSLSLLHIIKERESCIAFFVYKLKCV